MTVGYPVPEHLIDIAVEAYLGGVPIGECAELIEIHKATLRRHFNKRGIKAAHGNCIAPDRKTRRKVKGAWQRYCTQCVTYKAEELFVKDPRRSGGYANTCCKCKLVAQQEWRARTKKP